MYQLEHYYANRWAITTNQLQNYDWQTYGKIHANMPASTQKYMVKLMTGWLPVYHHTNKMTAAQQLCPLCQNDETIAHLFQCYHRQKWRDQLIKNFQEQLIKLKTPPDAQVEITHQVHQTIHDTQ